MMGFNESLALMLTPGHFLAVSEICLSRSNLACTVE